MLKLPNLLGIYIIFYNSIACKYYLKLFLPRLENLIVSFESFKLSIYIIIKYTVLHNIQNVWNLLDYLELIPEFVHPQSLFTSFKQRAGSYEGCSYVLQTSCIGTCI